MISINNISAREKREIIDVFIKSTQLKRGMTVVPLDDVYSKFIEWARECRMEFSITREVLAKVFNRRFRNEFVGGNQENGRRTCVKVYYLDRKLGSTDEGE